MRRIKYFLAYLILFSMVTSFPIFAEQPKTTEWSGKTVLKNGVTYTVSKPIKVNKEFVLPPKSSLIIRDGGKLTLSGAVEVVLHGNFCVEEGGVFAQKFGTVEIKNTSIADIKGEYLQYVNTVLKIQTEDFNVCEGGVYTGSAVLDVYKGAGINTNGKMTFTKSSIVTLSTDFINGVGAETRLQGQFSITKSGRLVNSGHISISRNGYLKNSGSFEIERKATYTRVGVYSETKSGSFMDYRVTFKYENMTVSILADEPETEIFGIDVSYCQEEIDWEKVKDAGVEFAIIRAGRGMLSPSKPMAADAWFERNMEGVEKNGIDAGVYFYSYAESVGQARKEAEFLVKLIAPYKLTYPVILDMEDPSQLSLGKELLTDMAEEFFYVLMENGYYPMIYSYKSWLENNLDMARLDKFAVWVAHTGVEETTYKGGYYIWQYSHTGKIDGIVGDADLNISYRDFPSILRGRNLNKLNS